MGCKLLFITVLTSAQGLRHFIGVCNKKSRQAKLGSYKLSKIKTKLRCAIGFYKIHCGKCMNNFAFEVVQFSKLSNHVYRRMSVWWRDHLDIITYLKTELTQRCPGVKCCQTCSIRVTNILLLYTK